MKQTTKIFYVRAVLLIVLPLVYLEPTYRELARAWRNAAVRSRIRGERAKWLDYWHNPLDHI